MKLGLGTVQFGLDYGISNQEGKTSAKEVSDILELALRQNIHLLDTAALYGNSEEVLGKFLPTKHSFDLVTKTPAFSKAPITPKEADLLTQTFHNSLAKLKQPYVYGLLLHHASDILAENGALLMEQLVALKQQGLVKKIGVSVYNATEIEQVLGRYSIDLIQLPINVLDQRLLTGGYLARLKAVGIEIHARSVFLQGLLLMNPQELPDYFAIVKGHLTRYHEWRQRQGWSALQAALGFALGLSELDIVVCGVNNRLQLAELCEVAQPIPSNAFAEFAIEDNAILNPTQWKL